MPSACAIAYADSARISGRSTAATTAAASRVLDSLRPSISLDPIERALRMRVESFAARERRGDRTERSRRLGRDIQHARALLEIVDAERRGESRRAARRQHVVRSGAIIAERL